MQILKAHFVGRCLCSAILLECPCVAHSHSCSLIDERDFVLLDGLLQIQLPRGDLQIECVGSGGRLRDKHLGLAFGLIDRPLPFGLFLREERDGDARGTGRLRGCPQEEGSLGCFSQELCPWGGPSGHPSASLVKDLSLGLKTQSLCEKTLHYRHGKDTL